MPIPGTAKAQQLLYQIARKHNTDPRSVIEAGAQQEYTHVKQEFCKAVKDSGISLSVAAQLLKIDRTTAIYHSNPEIRQRKRLRRKEASNAQDQTSP